jgi:protein-disulfide isomerase
MSSPTLTKRELREQRRAERQAAEAAEAARARRRRRLSLLGGAAALAAVLVVAAVVVSSSGGAAPKQPAPAKPTLFTGIPEHDGVLGNPKAKVTVTEFLDLQCPICAEASKSMLPDLVDTYVRTGKVKLQARPLHFIGADSVRAARVAAGAKEQGHLWPYLEAFYAAQGQENSGYVTDAFLRSAASAAGVDGAKVLAYAGTSAASAPMQQADAEATRLKVASTPTFVVARDGGAPTVIGSGVLDAATMQKAIDRELAR